MELHRDIRGKIADAGARLAESARLLDECEGDLIEVEDHDLLGVVRECSATIVDVRARLHAALVMAEL